jgi:hypothetical protein
LAIWNILRSFGVFYCHLVKFMVTRYIFPRSGMFYQNIRQPCPWHLQNFFLE